MAKEGVRKVNLLSELRQQLERKDYTGDRANGISVSFRFTSNRVDHTFLSTASVKASSLVLSNGLFKCYLFL